MKDVGKKKLTAVQKQKIAVAKVEKAIRRNKSQLPRLYVIPFWTINVRSEARRAQYHHIIVATDISPAHIKYFKIELDDYTRSPKNLMHKMMSMTGFGIVICLTSYRIELLIEAYRRLLPKGEKVVADGIFCCILKDFLAHGLLGTTFTTLDGSMFQFLRK